MLVTLEVSHLRQREVVCAQGEGGEGRARGGRDERGGLHLPTTTQPFALTHTLTAPSPRGGGVEGLRPPEHIPHVSHVGGIPRAGVGVGGGGEEEHDEHARHAGRVPTAGVGVCEGCLEEHPTHIRHAGSVSSMHRREQGAPGESMI